MDMVMIILSLGLLYLLTLDVDMGQRSTAASTTTAATTTSATRVHQAAANHTEWAHAGVDREPCATWAAPTQPPAFGMLTPPQAFGTPNAGLIFNPLFISSFKQIETSKILI
jgi:hypothetical protein